MKTSPALALFSLAAALAGVPCAVQAGAAAERLPADVMRAALAPAAPVPNAAYAPGADAQPAPPFTGVLHIAAAPLAVRPALVQSVVGGRDALRFPALSLEFLTLGETLVPVERGTMVAESAPAPTPSYWRVIPQFGRVWREPTDSNWARAAFPLMLVNDTENLAHQGLATFLYRDGEVSGIQFQFVQQTAPYLLSPHCVLWGAAAVRVSAADAAQRRQRLEDARQELAARLPAKPLAELRAQLTPGTLDGLGGPLLPRWRVAVGLVHEGTLYYEAEPTPHGDYPYPQEMRFGVRSVMKSIAAPLALLRLAQVDGPQVLDLRIGEQVPGLDSKWKRVRFIDAANMATGFGGTGSLATAPNEFYDGYLEADYDGWYTAPSVAEKIRHINEHLQAYPWEPGTVPRYRDQDYFLLGIAIDAYLKSRRGAEADAWRMLEQEVFAPIGIRHAPAVRTREPEGREGPVWMSAGYYPTLDDLAKIALLYLDHGAHAGRQILHRGLTEALLSAHGALSKDGSAPPTSALLAAAAPPDRLYFMGFHYTLVTGSRSGRVHYLPTMIGSGENEVILYPGRIASIRTANALWKNNAENFSGDPLATPRAVDRLSPF